MRILAAGAVVAILTIPVTDAAARTPAQRWRFYDDAPSPFLQYSTALQGDLHRTTIACDGPPWTILVEQGLSNREAAAGDKTLVVTVARSRLMLSATLGADEREDGGGRVAAAQLDARSADAGALQGPGPMTLIVAGARFQRPPVPRSAMRSFFAICHSQWARRAR